MDQKGREYIANKEYRYLSPVVLVKNADQHAAVFHSAALTNTPAITGMFAIINSDVLSIEKEEEEPKMELRELIQLLGLEEGTTEEDVLKRIKELVQQTGGEGQDGQEGKSGKEDPAKEGAQLVANKTVLDLLGLPENARTEDVTARIMAFKAGDSVLQQRVAELEKQAASQKAEELVGLAPQGWEAVPGPEGMGGCVRPVRPQGLCRICGEGPGGGPHGKDRLCGG